MTDERKNVEVFPGAEIETPLTVEGLLRDIACRGPLALAIERSVMRRLSVDPSLRGSLSHS